MATTPDEMPMDLKEQVVRIDKMQAELSKTLAEVVKVRQDTKLAPLTLAFTGLGAGAALFAAGGAFFKLLG